MGLLRDRKSTGNIRTIVHAFSPGGHRSSYLKALGSALEMEHCVGPVSGERLLSLLQAKKVLFATIDGSYRRFLFTAFLRSFMKKPTVGLFVGSTNFLRPEVTFRARALRHAMRFCSRLREVTIFTIVPHVIRPQLASFSTDWIHDPQLWDLYQEGKIPDLPRTKLSSRVEAIRAGRIVLIFIGKGSRDKGMPDVARIAAKRGAECLVVVAGRVSKECAEQANEMRSQGMIVEDRYVTEEEILSLYRVADLAWCFYPNSRDQASGIFGRAVQTGVVPVVRKGSVLEDYAKMLGIPALVLDKDSLLTGFCYESISAAEVRARHEGSDPLRVARALRKESLAKLRQAMVGAAEIV